MNKFLQIFIGVIAMPIIVLAINISVPSAPSSGYWLTSTTTGVYIATTTNPVMIGSLLATSSTATSTFAGGLQAGGSSGIYVLQNGNVGIGLSNPRSSLEVYQRLSIDLTSRNVSLGYLAGRDTLVDGTDNVFIGNQAGRNNTTADRNVAIGASSLLLNTSSSDNVAIGQQALYRLVSGSQNFALGRDSIRAATSSGQVAIGYRSAFGLANDWSGSYNIFIGRSTASNIVNGTIFNTCIGDNACTGDFTYGFSGTRNTFIGMKAGYTIGSGSYNVTIGQNADVLSTTTSRFLNIGNVIFGSNLYNGAAASSQPASGGKISIGTSTNQYALLTLWGSGTGTGQIFELVNNASTTISRFLDNGTGYFLGDIGIGTSTPLSKLHVSSGVSATTTISIGELGNTTSKACINMNQADGSAGSFFIAGGVIVVENNYCK